MNISKDENIFLHKHHTINGILKMDQYRKNEIFSDITLITKMDNKRIPAHKLCLYSTSEYFKTMFTSKFLKSEQREVFIDDMTGETLQLIVEYCYSGTIIITNDNVEDLLKASHYLQFNEIVNDCTQFLLKRLNPSNCLGIGQLLNTYSSKDIWNQAYNYINKHFLNVIENKQFLMLGIDQIEDILSRDKIDVDKDEQQVFKALKKWIDHDFINRRTHFVRLLGNIRLLLLPRDFIWIETVKWLGDETPVKDITHLIIQQNLKENNPREFSISKIVCPKNENQKILIEIYDAIKKTYHLIINKPILNNFKVTFLDNKIFLMYGLEEFNYLFLECFDILKECWTTISNELEYKKYFSLTVYKDEVFIIGGINKENEGTHTCQVINIKTKVIRNAKPMNCMSNNAEIGILNGKIYVIGGYDNHSYANYEECYDPVKDKWAEYLTINNSKYNHNVVTLNEFLYVIGGENGDGYLTTIKRYHPDTKKWTELEQENKPDFEQIISACALKDGILVVSQLQDKRTEGFVYNPVEKSWKPFDIQFKTQNFARRFIFSNV